MKKQFALLSYHETMWHSRQSRREIRRERFYRKKEREAMCFFKSMILASLIMLVMSYGIIHAMIVIDKMSKHAIDYEQTKIDRYQTVFTRSP